MLLASMFRFLRWLSVLIAVIPVVIVVACGDDPPATHLQPADLSLPDAGDIKKFDKDSIISLAAFTDGQAVSAKTVQEFLAKTPYAGRPSFLETYQSNGVRAAEAIVLAGRQHRINPIVLLVYAQALEGLVGTRFYPFPPERVEYVFRCGCFQSKTCLPELAGFDRQLDCLARSLRDAVNEIKANKKTAAGWGTESSQVTLDDYEVKPEDASTAAIYNQTPRIAPEEAGGTWLIWNLWNIYSEAFGYSEPSGGGDGRWIGEACNDADECSTAITNAECFGSDAYPDGFCSQQCDSDPCPSEDGKPATFCTEFTDPASQTKSYYCLPVCNAGAGPLGGCREGYQCNRRAGREPNSTADVCDAPLR
jgi:hypothetical protein